MIMGRETKRLLSIVLCLAMLVAMLPISVFALEAKMHIEVVASDTEVEVGDTVEYTITATGEGFVDFWFYLSIPEGMTYVANSAHVPLPEYPGVASNKWFEDKMLWSGYYDVPAVFNEGTVILTFSCIAQTVGTYEIELSDLGLRDEHSVPIEPTLLVDQVVVLSETLDDPICQHCYDGEWIVTTEPTCTEAGRRVRACSLCGVADTGSLTTDLPRCTGAEYTNLMDCTFPTVAVPGATELVLHFSDDSYLEFYSDDLYVYAGNTVDDSKLVGIYSGPIGTQKITVPGDSFTLRLTTNLDDTYYGFELTEVEYEYPDRYETVDALGHIDENGDNVCDRCDDLEDADYFLFGWINGAYYAYQEDWENMGEYRFVGGKLVASFAEDSYIGVKKKDNAAWYMTENYVDAATGTFKNLNTGDVSEMMRVPGGVELAFTLTVHDDDTLTLTYSTCVHSYVSNVTAPTCTEAGYTTYTCSRCGDSYEGNLVTAVGHSYEDGICTVCGCSDPNDYSYDLLSNGTCIITGYNGNATSLVIPFEIDGYLVTHIGNSAFSWCTDLERITLPNGVTSIGDNAFKYCESLDEITLPVGLTSIGDHAFRFCESLDEITLPNSVTSIGDYAFKYCESLDEITLPVGLTSIGTGAFMWCSSLTEITIPDGVTSIGDHVFAECESLTEIIIPDSVTSIGYAAFDACTSLIEITLPDGVTSIGDYAFEDCYSMYEIIFPDSLISIGNYAFSGCNYLEQISIPNGVTSIGKYAFYECYYLTDIVIPSNIESIQAYAFGNCSSLTNVYFQGSREMWNTVSVSEGNDPLINATFHFALVHTHTFGEWKVDLEPTCVAEGQKHQACTGCDYIVYETVEKLDHTYGIEVVPPTYFEQGYSVHTCSACGDTYTDTYVDPFERIKLSAAMLELEYTSAFYEGVALFPKVTLIYEGETYDTAKELKITYSSNDQVGTATVTVEGVNKFVGTVELQFEIIYESIPAQIVNVAAVGEIGEISLAWGKSSEVKTDRYNIYKKSEDETEYCLFKTITGRDVLSYEDKSVEKGKTYYYYVTGVGLYGAESEPSIVVSATVQVDHTAPTVLKMSPAAAGVISGETTLSVTAMDNVGVTSVVYFYSVDNGATWLRIGETTNQALNIAFDTSVLEAEAVKVKAIAYDAEGNESAPFVVAYSLDNVGPEKVTGLAATVLSSKITLSWKDVAADDAAAFILQTNSNGEWTTVAGNITTLGYTMTGLNPDTDYVYRVACVDKRGNIGEYSDAFTAKTAADGTAPVITDQSPDPDRYSSTIHYSVTARDDCDIQSINIQVSTDLNNWVTISTNEYSSRMDTQSYGCTIDLSPYAEGSIFLRAIATDFSGNISDTGDTAPYVEYIIDRTAPKAPENVTAEGKDGYITVSWGMGTAMDLGKYFVYRSADLNGEYQLIASNLASLNYHDRDVQSGTEFFYKVSVSDTCGNMSAYSDVASAIMLPDTQKPEIIGISETYLQKISNSIHTVNVVALDNNKLSYVVVEYATSSDGEYSQLTKTENINHHYKNISVSLPVENMVDGDMIFLRAYAVDMAGLQSEYVTAQYTVDTTAPEVQNFDVQLSGSSVTLNWNDCGESDLAGFKVYRSNDRTSYSLVGSKGVNSEGSYNFADMIYAQESGTYYYKLEAMDRLGNTATWVQSVDYTYDGVYTNQEPIAQAKIPRFMTVGVEDVLDASGSVDDIAIVSYLWDFGDGTTSSQIKPAKSYAAAGTYCVTLTVTDSEGATSMVTGNIEVKEREQLGTLNVKVVDENGAALSYVPVYFDLGSEDQRIIYTNSSGVATLRMMDGTHTIGMYASGYLPVKKDVVVLPNAIRTVTLTTVKEDIVTGHFEVTRMTFDEIVAAGIDVYDPANQHVYSATVRMTYGFTAPIIINYIRNNNRIIDYTVSDEKGKPIQEYTNPNGEKRKIASITYIPAGGGGGGNGGSNGGGKSDVIAIVDIPASASYLKEFFDVKLHIINNASPEFVLRSNEVVLNVPNGMTLMDSVTDGYETTNTVRINSLRGQETVTLAWLLRGDVAGEYDLSADFIGTLAEFNELVSARFETNEPIKVYGLDGVQFRILASDEIHNDTLYFNVELENQRDVDIYLPNIGITDKVENVTESVLNGKAEDDFYADAYLMNAYIQTGNGKKQYVPITYDKNNRITTNIKTLAPGQKIVYEYVAYNAVNFDGIGYFKEAAIVEFEGLLENIEVGSFHKTLYSFTDYPAKLDAILNGTDPDVTAAFNYIKTDSNYYYVNEANKILDTALKNLYKIAGFVLSGDTGILTQDEERDLIQRTILNVLSDESVYKLSEDFMMDKYTKAVTSMIDAIKIGTIDSYVTEGITEADIAKVFAGITKKSKKLAITYREKGSEEFKKELVKMIAESSLGITIDIGVTLSVEDEIKAFSDLWDVEQELIKVFLSAADESRKESIYFAILKYQCNAQMSEIVLDAIIENTQTNLLKELQYAIAANLLPMGADILALRDIGLGEEVLILETARSMKETLNSNQEEFYGSMRDALNYVEDVGGTIASFVVKSLVKKAIGSTPLALVSAGFSIIDAVFGWGEYTKQQDAMEIYKAFSDTFKTCFYDSIQSRNQQADFYSMIYLRALCEIRLDGESQYKHFINNYLNGVHGSPLKEETVLKEINKVKGTSYASIDRWWDDVQYMTVSSRDILFNIEQSATPIEPAAPEVILNYDKLQTIQSFSSEYEYCFADGSWKPCKNEPIAFDVGVVPGTLRVRMAATDETLAGKITTVKIFARKNLSKLITVRFDGVNYLIDNLSNKYKYQVIFMDSPEDQVDWSEARTISGSSDTVAISGVKAYSYMLIRSCHDDSLEETTSNPLLRTVSIKQKLNLVISGCGTVAQTDHTGYYFVGDTVELTAATVADSQFLSWNVNGVCVSVDEYYLLEMAEGLEVTAAFSGSNIRDVSISKMPQKLQYRVGETVDVSGMEVTVTYEDGTSMVTDHYTAQLTNNTVGASQVAVCLGENTVYYDIVICCDAQDHIEETVPGYAATCTEDGLTDGTKCSVCGDTLVEQEVIPATGEHLDADNSGCCDACNGLMQPAALCKVSASLKGNIALNYYMLLSDEVLSDETAYMQFTMADGEIIRIPVGQGVKHELDGESYYVFTCAVNAKEMTDTVLSQFFYEGGVTREHSYSVQTYAKHILASYDDAATRNLIISMLNYGAASQLHFGYNTDRLANSELETPDYTGVTIKGFNAVSGQGTELAKLYSASLILKSETTLRFFFRVDSSVENFTVTYHGQALEVKQRSGLYYVDVVGISAKKLDENVTISIHDGTNTTEVSFNPMSYSQGVLNDTSGAFGQEMKNLVAALYQYNQAANVYFKEG